jgi:hypothetical protein
MLAARFGLTLVLLPCAVGLAGCKKTHPPAPKNAVTSAPVPSTDTQRKSERVTHFTGEVEIGQEFEKSFAPNMVFKLEAFWRWSALRLADSSCPRVGSTF